MFSTCLWRLGIMLPTQGDLISGDFHAEARPTEEMTERTIKLEGDRLSNGEIICAPAKFAFYRWISGPKNKLQRSLSERLNRGAWFERAWRATIRSAALARTQYWATAI